MKVGRGFYIYADGFVSSGMVAGIFADARVTDKSEAFLIALAIVIGDGANFVVAGLEGVWGDLKGNGFAIAIAGERKSALGWGRSPTVRETQMNRAFGWTLDVAPKGA